MTKDLSSFHTIVVKAQGLIAKLEQTDALAFAEIILGSKDTLEALQNLLKHYRTLDSDKQRNWDRTRFGSKNTEMDILQKQMLVHTQGMCTCATLCIAGLHMGQVRDFIKDKVSKEPRLITGGNVEDPTSKSKIEGQDDESAWRQLRRDLLEAGYQSKCIRDREDQKKAFFMDERQKLMTKSKIKPRPVQTQNDQRKQSEMRRLSASDIHPGNPPVKSQAQKIEKGVSTTPLRTRGETADNLYKGHAAKSSQQTGFTMLTFPHLDECQFTSLPLLLFPTEPPSLPPLPPPFL